MRRVQQPTAIIEREGDGFVALCPELDVASQGQTIEEARANLKEAVELFLDLRQRGFVEVGSSQASVRNVPDRSW